MAMTMMKEFKEEEDRLAKKIENIQKTIDSAVKVVTIIVYIITLAIICKIIVA